jgi:hypothetical protein
MPIEGNFNPGIPFYTGPGDLFNTWAFWIGVRAFSSAAVGSNMITARRSSDNSTKTFNVLSNGSFNTSDPFFDGSNYFATTMYDQTGNGHNFSQATAANQPGLLLAGGPRGLPTLTFLTANSQFMFNAGVTGSVAQPYTLSAVFNITNDGTNEMVVGGGVSAVGIIILEPAAAPNNPRIFGGNVQLAVSANDGSWHAGNGYVNDPNSVFSVDGTSSGAGNTAFSAAGYGTGNGIDLGADGGGHFLTGNAVEMGVMTGGGASTSASLNANQRGYWGF